MAPAHPHATGVAVYPALFENDPSILIFWFKIHILCKISDYFMGHAVYFHEKKKNFMFYANVAQRMKIQFSYKTL